MNSFKEKKTPFGSFYSKEDAIRITYSQKFHYVTAVGKCGYISFSLSFVR